MTWTERIDNIKKLVEVALEAEAHALAMVGLGALMCLHGSKDQGQLIIGAGLAVFKGKS